MGNLSHGLDLRRERASSSGHRPRFVIPVTSGHDGDRVIRKRPLQREGFLGRSHHLKVDLCPRRHGDSKRSTGPL
jgi:hypothetical protein